MKKRIVTGACALTAGLAAAAAGFYVAARTRRRRCPSRSKRPRSRTCIEPSSRARSPAGGWCRRTSIAPRPTTAWRAPWSPQDGAPIAPATGTVRAGAPLKFPTDDRQGVDAACPISIKYTGPPLEFGRMEPTASDPSVQQQYGMIVGMPNAGQVNALGTFNLRGERSVTCKGDFDKRRRGPLPAGAPAVCEEFRKQPDALERAAELDAQYGRNPDLAAMPMYCIPFSFKDPFDTKDMRSTGGADARYDIDFPARDHVAGRAASQQGRDHLRQVGPDRVQRPRRRSRRQERADEGPGVDPRLSAQHAGAATRRNAVRHHPRRLARLELGIGGLGQHEPRDVRPLRGDARVVPRTGQPQLGRADPAAQGADRLRRRRHRLRHLQRPHRHPLPQHHRRGEGARRAEGSEGGLLRSARRLHHRPAVERAQPSLRARRAATPGTPGSLKGMRIGIIRESMLHAPGRQGRRADRHGRGRGRSRRCSAARSAPRSSNRPIRCGPTTRRSRT